MASDDDAPGELNLTPYLDVLMNLIVFVLVSGAGLLTYGALPATTTRPGLPTAVAVAPRVHLDHAGLTVSVAGEAPAPVTLDALSARLAAVGGRALTIAAERDVTLEQVAATMDAARKAHFDEITLAD